MSHEVVEALSMKGISSIVIRPAKKQLAGEYGGTPCRSCVCLRLKS